MADLHMCSWAAELISLDGCHPVPTGYRRMMYSIGPMCRYATDLLPMLRVLAGKQTIKDVRVDFSRLKFYYCEGLENAIFSSVSREMAGAMYAAVKHFYISYGAEVRRMKTSDLPLMYDAVDIWINDMLEPDEPRFAAHMTDSHEETLNVFKHLALALVNLTKHTVPALVLAVYEKLHIFFKDWAKDPLLIKKRQTLVSQFEELLGDGSAVFLFPSHPTPAPFHSQPLFQPFNFVYTALFNSLGFPVTQVPLGLSANGLPIGVQVMAPMGYDALAIKVAVELERGLGGWVNFGHED